MNRDLLIKEMSNEVRDLFGRHMHCVDKVIKDGKLHFLKNGCPAIDDELMLPMANKMCGVDADFIYFYTLFSEDKKHFMEDREMLKEITGIYLETLREENKLNYDDATLIETNVISTRNEDIDCHFICFLMKRKVADCNA